VRSRFRTSRITSGASEHRQPVMSRFSLWWMAVLQCTDVSKRLGKFENTAPGDDGLTYRHWKRLDPKCTVLTEVINVCLRYHMVPPA